jgi:metallo-beta-lactamase family protein
MSYAGKKTLIDCGLFQGPKELRLLNWAPFIEPQQISEVILTHAHIDHSGYLPRFVKDGYSGPVYASEGTADLLGILLPDSAYLQEEDAGYANKTGHSHHRPALPLYDTQDATKALKLIQRVKRNEWHQLRQDVSFRLLRSGHIIGSSFVQLAYSRENGNGLITFSGDLGNGRSPTLTDPVSVSETDYLILESTYGNRLQSRTDPLVDLERVVNKVIGREGVLLIPAFSVGRSQDILFLLRQLEKENRIPRVGEKAYC